MLPQRLRWLLPALIVSWMHLQLGAALPAHDERSSHVSVNTFDPSATTSTMIRQDYNKRGHPPDGKNDTQSSQKLVASPAGLLRPDKFQFYTYNDKGDMITRQMTVQEIQGLIAAGGADHIAMDRQEPQKADDVLTGGKKVMDVVQKVQNVLKSALDKPLILTGTVPKIPEHANVEWSNILPSILSGEVDAISQSSSEPSHKFTTEETATGSASNIGTNATSNDAKKPAMQLDVQTNAYGGFANNMEHGERPQYIHYPQQAPAAGAFSEKPMIPVPVITLTEQKLTTLQSVITESPVFQMLSVIPVEATDLDHHQQDQLQPTQTEEASQTEQFIELALSEVPETLTPSQSMNSDAYFASFPKQTTANLDDKGGMGFPTTTYSTTTSSISTISSAVDIKQTVAHKGVDEATTSKISSSSPSSANYAVAENKNNTKLSEDPSFALGVTKEPQVNGIQSDEKLISQTNTANSKPLSHAPTAPKPEEMSNEPVLLSHSLSTFASVSRIETSTVPILSHTNRLNEATSKVTEKLSVNSVTPTYTKDHLRPTEIQSSVSMEPLPTQLIDSFSSVMSQISEAKPPVLSLSSTSGGLPEMTMMNINHDQRHNMSDDSVKNTLTSVNNRYDTLTAHGANEENIERVAVGSQTYPTVAVKLPPLNVATRTTSYSTTKSTTTQRPTSMGMDKVSIVKAGMNKISLKPSVSSTTEMMNNGIVINNIAMTSTSNVKSTDTTTSSPMWVQLEKIQNVSLESLTESSAIFGTTTAINTMLQKHTPGGATSPEEILPVTSSVLDATKTPSTSASMDLNVSLKRPTPTSEYFDDTLMNLNLSDPVSAIDQILNIVPLPFSTPTVEPISLPNDTSNIVTSDLASGLIAGFLTTSEKSPFEEINGNQVTKITSSARPTVSTVGATKPAEFIENVTQIHKGTVTLNVPADRPKESITYTQTSTQQTLVTSPVKSSTVGSSTHTKESTMTSGNKNVLTTKPTKLPNSSEKINDSTKVSSSSLLGNFASGNYVSKGNTERSTIAMGAITASPQRLSTTNSDVRPLYTNKTQLYVTSNQDKKDNREKIKTTEAPIVRTDVGSELSSPVKVASMNSAGGNNTRNMNSSVHTESSSKIETSSEKNQFSANTSTTQQSVAVHQQHHNFSSLVTGSVNGSKSELHGSHKHHSNVTTGTGISNITFNTANLSTEYSTSSRPAFAQNTNRVSNATTLDKNKGTTTPMGTTISSHTATNNRTTVTSRPMQSNKTDILTYNISSSSPSSSPSSSSGQVSAHTDRPIIKVVTQAPSGNVSGNHEKPSRPSLANGTKPSNPINKTSNQRDKIVSPQHTTQIMPIESTDTSGSTQTNGEFNSTESKPASLKHSENSPKPDVVRPQSSMPNVPARPSALKPTVGYKPLEKSDVSKPEADTDTEEKWTLISQQTPPAMSKLPKPPKPLRKPPSSHVSGSSNPDENGNVRIPGPDTTTYQQDDPPQTIPQPVLPLDASQSASGLDVTVKHTSTDIVNFAKLCNELAFNYWVATNKGLSTARSLALSPFGMTSLLAMIFLGARGPTSDQMNEVLGLDDVTTFNPHLVFQNITDTVGLARGQGIANAAFVRELFADKMKVRKLMPFYKEQAQQFYEGLVAEVNFATISDLVRRRTNLLIRKQTGGRIKDFVKTNTVPLRSPLAALSANVFQTDCNTTLTSSVGRDGELYFAVSPAVRQRRLVPVPATTWRSGVLAGYEPSIDATAVALGGSDKLVSTIFLLPGQQGHTAPGDTLDRLEQRLVRSAFRDGTWNKLLKVLTSRSGLELQVPKFSHRSVVNATAALKRMGLDELFSGNADFKGINGVGHRLHLADVLQMNLFSTCGDENILSGRHHVETYPASPLRSIRRRVEDIDGSDDVAEDDMLRHSGVSLQKDHTGSLHADRPHTGRFRREKRQLSTTSERPRLKLDRPFLYFVRHNPSGIILHMGRFNPRLLP